MANGKGVAEKRATWKQVQAEAARHGGYVEKDENSMDLYAYAPKHAIWKDGCSTLVEPFANNGGQSWKPRAYADLIDRMQSGIIQGAPSEFDGWWDGDDESAA